MSGSGTAPPNLEARLRATLAPLRETALGLAEAHHSWTNQAITGFERRDPDDYRFSGIYKQLDNFDEVPFYGIVKRSKSTGAEDCKDDVEDREWRAAITHRMCQKTVYCLIDEVRRLLSNDPDVANVIWSRRNIRPNIIAFEDKPVYRLNAQIPEGQKQTLHPIEHDLIIVRCQNNIRFALDLAGDQFGLPNWFYRWQDYRQYIRSDLMDPWNPTDDEKKTVLNQQEPRLPRLKAAVEHAMASAEFRVFKTNTVGPMGWANFHQQSAGNQDQLLEGVREKVKKSVVKTMAQSQASSSSGGASSSG